MERVSRYDERLITLSTSAGSGSQSCWAARTLAHTDTRIAPCAHGVTTLGRRDLRVQRTRRCEDYICIELCTTPRRRSGLEANSAACGVCVCVCTCMSGP